jgi:FMN phosphatase YigB (HAD superfamily)
MGKPRRDFFHQVVVSMPFKVIECLMVGDDILGILKGLFKRV